MLNGKIKEEKREDAVTKNKTKTGQYSKELICLNKCEGGQTARQLVVDG